jgi:hypothetical protein
VSLHLNITTRENLVNRARGHILYPEAAYPISSSFSPATLISIVRVIGREPTVSVEDWRNTLQAVVRGGIQGGVTGTIPTPQGIDAGWPDVNFVYLAWSRLSAAQKNSLLDPATRQLTLTWADLVGQGAGSNLLVHPSGDVLSEFPAGYGPPPLN